MQCVCWMLFWHMFQIFAQSPRIENEWVDDFLLCCFVYVIFYFHFILEKYFAHFAKYLNIYNYLKYSHIELVWSGLHCLYRFLWKCLWMSICIFVFVFINIICCSKLNRNFCQILPQMFAIANFLSRFSLFNMTKLNLFDAHGNMYVTFYKM